MRLTSQSDAFIERSRHESFIYRVVSFELQKPYTLGE